MVYSEELFKVLSCKSVLKIYLESVLWVFKVLLYIFCVIYYFIRTIIQSDIKYTIYVYHFKYKTV